MRKIKIRAWDKKNKKWLDGNEWAFDPEKSGAWYLEFGEMMDEIEDVIIVQYTGLKDKNGKEIYEGDIVKGIFYNAKSEISQVIWHEKSGGFLFFGYPLNIHGLHDIEIIGNIYENPELLNK